MNVGIIMLGNSNLVALAGFFPGCSASYLERVRIVKVKMVTFYMRGKRGQKVPKLSTCFFS